MTRRSTGAILVLVFGLTPSPSDAVESQTEAYFSSDIYADFPVIAVSAALWAVPVAMDTGRRAASCDPYCDPRMVNSWDRRVVDNQSHGAKIASDVLVVALPAQAIWLVLGDALHLGSDEGATDFIVLSEVLTVAGAINQLVKITVERPRPYMYREAADDGLRKNNADDYRSFYSQHTSTVFSVLTAAAFIYSKRYPESGLRRFVWIAAFFGGATVAALRVTAGKHFYTDVFTGAAAGIAVGLVVPALHLRRHQEKKAFTLYPSGLGAVGSF